MFNELAAAAKMDPIAFRMANTTATRLQAVMNAVKTESKWETRPSPARTPRPPARRRSSARASASCSARTPTGPAPCTSAITPSTGKVPVLDVTTAVDPGIVINPMLLRRNAQAGAIQGVSESLHEEVTFNKSGITDRDWVSYPILRIADAPKVKR